MFPSTLLATLLLAFSVAANPVVIDRSPVTLSLSRRVNVTSIHNLVRHDQNRAKALKAKGAAKAAGVPLDGRAVINEQVDNQAVTYIASVGVGSPATTYSLLIDTGSSNTWVGAGTAYVRTSTSTQTTNRVSVTYGSGSFSGTEFTDQVTLATGLVIPRQSIGVASTSTGFDGVDGILGIGPVDLTQGTLSPATSSLIPTVTDNLFSQGAITANEIGISFEPTTTVEVMNGELTWGGTDSSKFTGAITFIPITTTSPASLFWGINESIRCPVHKCHVCKKGENKEVEDLQFAICRRCPKAYHRKCMPRKIAFEDIEEEDIIQRAWDDLIPNRILIYCLKHAIDEDLGTPKRNHIIFPDVVDKKRVRPVVKKNAKRKDLVSEDSLNEKIAKMKLKKIGEKKDVEEHDCQSPKKLFKKSKETIASRKPFMADRVSLKVEKSVTPEDSKASVKMEKSTTSLPNKGSASVKSKPKDLPSGKHEKTVPPTSFMKSNTSLPVIDSETEKRIMAIVKRSSSSLTLEDVMKKHKVPSTHSYSSRHVDRTITQGKVEGSVEAVRTALQKLEEGCSIEDAKAVCGPDILNQIMKWKNKLKVYLSPFLHGMRYTSFGRHFTKADKLKEIVEKLHWYVQKGDMIVDFCCGANDFSRLMKNKLEETGKECFFKNYDVIQPKDDFNFEKRDWMTVRQGELPTGSKLIMGLNPPFGVKAALANKFIDKALEFKPKLLILIVPKETERLDEKEQAYDLIWEDSERLTGKSFYLPGSIDVYDKQLEQWNLKPPLLYLWSRSDWTAKHKAIATRQGHMSQQPEESSIKENDEEAKVEDQKDDHDFYGDIAKMLNDLPVLNDQAEALEVKRTVSPGEQMEESVSKDDNQTDRGRCEDNDSRTDRSGREDGGSRTDRSRREDNDIRTDQTRHEDGGSRTDWNTREDGDSITDQSGCEDDDRRTNRSRREDDDSRTKHEDDDRQTNRSRREYNDGREDHESRRHRKDKRSSESFVERETEWEYKKQLKSMDEAWKGKHDRSRTPVGEFYDMGMPRSINSPSNRNDRSIGSPSNRNDSRSFLDNRPSEALETTSLGREGSEEGFLRFQRDRSGSVSEFGTGYGANQMSIPVEELDDIERRYRTKDGPFASGAWSNSSGSGIQGLEGRFPSYSNDTTIDNFNRNPYRDVHSRIETFGGQDVDPVEKYGRSSADISRQIPLYGRHGPSDVPHRSLPPLGQDSGLGQTVSLSKPYGFSPLAVDPSRLDSSVTQRYAPRLDEMNYTRSSPFTPTEVRPSIMYNSPGSHAGLHSSGIQGFAAGPHHHFPHHNSSGWLND